MGVLVLKQLWLDLSIPYKRTSEIWKKEDASFYEEIEVCLFLVKDLREVLYAQVVYPQLTVNPCNDFHRCRDTWWT